MKRGDAPLYLHGARSLSLETAWLGPRLAPAVVAVVAGGADAGVAFSAASHDEASDSLTRGAVALRCRFFLLLLCGALPWHSRQYHLPRGT